MKKYRLIIWLLVIFTVASCSQSGESGELIGSTQRGKWFEPVPFGMTFIPRGSIRIGPSDENPTGSITPTNTISIDAFWMDDSEITNNEYRQFVNWVIDSSAVQLLYNNDPSPGTPYAFFDENDIFLRLDLKAEYDLNSDDSIALDPIIMPIRDRFFGRKEIDARKLIFDYAWIDFQEAAKRQNSFVYDYNEDGELLPNTGRYASGVDRIDFLHHERVPVYPDTLCWIRDFTYSYNEPWAQKYFWHPGFDEYPVVGVNWKQANAFCQWRTKMQNSFFSQIGSATVMDYRLPTEFEWEYAARGGLQNSMYPWGGYYSRNQNGEFMANYKPMRGNYIVDGGLATMKVGSYPPNDFGLYDMSGNVAEWTITAFDPMSKAVINQLNPDFKYNAKETDPPAMKRKVIRGGSWKDVGFYMQVSTSTYEYQDTAKSYIGFRCVRSSFGNDF
ncbi:MAG: SUMF1/EgtB/PvdO family nonheme iron enzyme [Prolixibacteraceae bacterium]|nr:SUMF1/EgtB/PvdO family nonheme iron enzyme [Prolixibacteraceae bacterium]